MSNIAEKIQEYKQKILSAASDPNFDEKELIEDGKQLISEIRTSDKSRFSNNQRMMIEDLVNALEQELEQKLRQ